MDEVSIPKTSGRVGLRIYRAERSPGGSLDYFTVEVADPTIRAAVRVYAYGADGGLLELFAAMAREWKGWSGAKKWATVESDFSLSCTQDKTGHVRVDITLTNSSYPDHWTLHASAQTEAGLLEALAASARCLVVGQSGAS